VLILHGSADKATKPSGSQFFYDTAGSKDKTVKLYRGARPRPPERSQERGRDGRCY